MSAADKQKVAEAVAAYVEAYPGDVNMADLRGFIRDRSGLDFGGPALAHSLKRLGFVRDGLRTIDSCPGRATFYRRAAA